MNNWLDRLNGRVAIALASVLAAIFASYLTLARPKTDPTSGWETTETARQPFKPGILVNGHPAPDYDIQLIEPNPESRVVAKPGEPIHYVVKASIVDFNSPNADVAPSFVQIRIARRKRTLRLAQLKPSSRDETSFTFSGQISAPDEPGEYKTYVESWYANRNLTGKNSETDDIEFQFKFDVDNTLDSNRPDRKTLEGQDIHVIR